MIVYTIASICCKILFLYVGASNRSRPAGNLLYATRGVAPPLFPFVRPGLIIPLLHQPNVPKNPSPTRNRWPQNVKRKPPQVQPSTRNRQLQV